MQSTQLEAINRGDRGDSCKCDKKMKGDTGTWIKCKSTFTMSLWKRNYTSVKDWNGCDREIIHLDYLNSNKTMNQVQRTFVLSIEFVYDKFHWPHFQTYLTYTSAQDILGAHLTTLAIRFFFISTEANSFTKVFRNVDINGYIWFHETNFSFK